MTIRKIKFENILMVVPLLFLAVRKPVQTRVQTSQRMRKRKASTRTPFVVKQRKELVTYLEQCCMTT